MSERDVDHRPIALPLIFTKIEGQKVDKESRLNRGNEEEILTTRMSYSSSTSISCHDMDVEDDRTKFPLIAPLIDTNLTESLLDKKRELLKQPEDQTDSLMQSKMNPSESSESLMDCNTAEKDVTFNVDVPRDNLSLLNPGASPLKAPESFRPELESSFRFLTSIWAKADRVGYLVECSDQFLDICGLKKDFKEQSILNLVRPMTPEIVQQQAYLLDSIASSKLNDVNRKKKWIAELKHTHMDVVYEIHVTYAVNSDSSYALNVELKDVPCIAKTPCTARTLSRHDAQVSFGKKSTSNSKRKNLKSLLILIVDDSITVLKMVKRLITEEGHEVVCKTNGIEALEALKTTEFDAVFMDILMPVMGGLEASFEFRIHEGMLHQYRNKAQSSKLKIIAMSADFSETLIIEVLHAGFDGFLAKPLTVKEFRNLRLGHN